MNWHRKGYDLMVSDAGYYVTRHKMAKGYWYNGWKGNYRERDLREHIDAGPDAETVKRACEAKAQS